MDEKNDRSVNSGDRRKDFNSKIRLFFGINVVEKKLRIVIDIPLRLNGSRTFERKSCGEDGLVKIDSCHQKQRPLPPPAMSVKVSRNS